MKKIILLIISLTVILSSCQPTPEKEIVVGKSEDAIQAMIDTAQTGQDEIPQENYEPILNDYEAPQRLEYVITSNFEGAAEMEIRVNADVIIPEYALPMYRIEYTDIPYDNLQSAVELISNGETLYRREYAQRIKIQSDIQFQIDCYNYELEFAEGSAKSRYEDLIKELLVEYENAPKTYEEPDIQPDDPENLYETIIDENGNQTVEQVINPMDWLTEDEIGPFMLNEMTYQQSQYLIVGQGERTAPRLNFIGLKPEELTAGRYHYPMIYFNDSTAENDLYLGFVFTSSRDLDEMDALIPLDEALETANIYAEAIDPQLEVSGIAAADRCLYLDEGKQMSGYGYTIYFSKSYNGITLNYADSQSYYTDMLERQSDDSMRATALYSVPYPPEMLKVTVGPDGVTDLVYQSPSKIIECISNDVELLPFDEIEAKFKEYIRYNGWEQNKIYMDIDRIELNLMAIEQPDSDEYLVVPVWDFYGGAVLSSGTSSLTEEQYWNEQLSYFYGRSFLTINAVNGSIIDRAEGY